MALVQGAGSAPTAKYTKQGGLPIKVSGKKAKKSTKSGAQPYKLSPFAEFAGPNQASSIREARLKYGTKVVASAQRGAGSGGGGRGGSGGGSRSSRQSGINYSGMSGINYSGMPKMPQGETLEEKLWREALDRTIAEYEKQKREAEEQYGKATEEAQQRLNQELAANTVEKAKRGLLFSTLKTDADAQLQAATNRALEELANKKIVTINDINEAISRERKATEDKIAASKFERSLKEWELKAGVWADVEKARQLAAISAASSRSGGGGSRPAGGRRASSSSSTSSRSSRGLTLYQAMQLARQADKEYASGIIPGPVRGEIYRRIWQAGYTNIRPPRIIPRRNTGAHAPSRIS